MLRLKHETELEVTILSGNEFQILTIRLVKKFLSRKEPSLAILNELQISYFTNPITTEI